MDDLIDAVEGLYPSERLRQQQESPAMAAVYLTAPKRAQKFIRFGKKWILKKEKKGKEYFIILISI